MIETDACEREVTDGLGPTLGPTRRPGPVGVGRDPLQGHQATRLRAARAARPCARHCLPAAAPDGPPIAPACSTITAVQRGLGARTRATRLAAVRRAVAALTRAAAVGWVAPAGYALPGQDT